MSRMSLATAEAVALAPAPGPASSRLPTKSPSMATQLVTPDTSAMAECLGTMAGCTRCSMPLSVTRATPSSLMRKPRSSAASMSAWRDGLDALHVDLLEGDVGAEGEAGEQRELVGRVEAADVEAGIGLGIAHLLGLLEHLGERAMILLHLRQDEVAGAVEDAVDAADLVGGQRLAQRLDDGDAAGDRRLEVERDAVLLGELCQLEAVRGQQRLVGGDHVLAGAERRLDRRLGDAVTADQLDEDVYRGIGGEALRRVEPLDALERNGALLGAVAGRHAGDLEAAAGVGGKPGPVRAQKLNEARAHRAEPGDAQFQRLAHGSLT